MCIANTLQTPVQTSPPRVSIFKSIFAQFIASCAPHLLLTFHSFPLSPLATTFHPHTFTWAAPSSLALLAVPGNSPSDPASFKVNVLPGTGKVTGGGAASDGDENIGASGGESGGDDAAGASGSNEVAAEEQSMHDGAGRGGKHDTPVCGSTPDDPCPSRETPGGGAGPGGMLWVEVPRAVATANALANAGQSVAGAHAKAHAAASSIRTHAKAHGHRVGQILEEHSSQIEDLLLAAHVPGNLNPTTQQQRQQQQGTKGNNIEQSMGADGERSIDSSSESSSSSGSTTDSGPESSSSNEPAGSSSSSTGSSTSSSSSPSSGSGSGSSNSSTADDSSTNISSLTSGVGSSDTTTGSPKSVEIDSVGSSSAASTDSSSRSSSRSDSGSSSSGIGSASGSGSAVITTTTSTLAPTIETTTTTTEEPTVATTTSTLAPTIETTATTTTTSSTVCADTPKGWASSTAVNCQQYAERKWCTNKGKYGTGWKKGYVSFAKWANKGVDATQACCVCGGGSTATAAGPSNDAFSKIAERQGGANPQPSDKNIQYVNHPDSDRHPRGTDSGSGSSASTQQVAWAELKNQNIPGADLNGCAVTGDITQDDSKKQICKKECEDDHACVAVVFHPWGTMLKKKTDGMVKRKRFITMIIDRGDDKEEEAYDGGVAQQVMSKMDEVPQNERVRVPL